MLTNSCQKVAPRFCCETCDYNTDKKSSYDKHLITTKHIKLTNVNDLSNFSCHKVATDIKEFICDNCNKHFKSRVGLWKHKKNCNLVEVISNAIHHEPTDKDLIMLLIKENSELKNLVIKVLENGTVNNSHNTTTHKMVLEEVITCDDDKDEQITNISRVTTI